MRWEEGEERKSKWGKRKGRGSQDRKEERKRRGGGSREGIGKRRQRGDGKEYKLAVFCSDTIVQWEEGEGMERGKEWRDLPTSLMVFFFLSNKMFSILRSLCVCVVMGVRWGEEGRRRGADVLTQNQLSLVQRHSLVMYSLILNHL